MPPKQLIPILMPVAFVVGLYAIKRYSIPPQTAFFIGWAISSLAASIYFYPGRQ
jgi:hypothetical protein